MGAGRRAAACDVFSYHEEVHGGFERPEVERITKEEKDARQKRKNQNSKVYMERTFISGGQWHFDTDRKNQSVIFGMVFYLYLQRPGVCDRAVVWESSIFVCGAESLCCDFLMIGTGIHAAFESRKAGRKAIWQWLAGLFLGGCIMLLVFVINCGINYHRESFSEKSGLKIQTYSVKDLQATCQWLTEEVNRLSTQVERTENGELQLPEEIRQEAVRSMQALGRQYPALQGYYPNPKPVLVSEILSYQKLMGIYAPFTIEANYNQDMPSYDFPFTMCHELSHLRGFMQEEETNFISFLACRESDMTEFQYSGTLSAWEYAMNALYRADPKVWQEVREGLSKAAEPDLRADDQFWSEYDGSVAEVANMVNDTYLKANGQKQGVKSYGKMTDLLVAYDQSL